MSTSVLLPTFARTLYVTENGSDTGGQPDDPSAPYSLTSAVAALQNGDELIITQGHYPVVPGFPNDRWPAPDYSDLPLRNLTNVTIKGIGEVDIYGEGPGNFMMIEFCSDLVIENLTFRGNRPEVPDDTEEFPLFAMVHLRGTNSALTFSGCKFLQFGNHGISQILPPHVAYDVTVTNCYFLEGGDGYLAHRNGDPDGSALSGMGPGWLVVSNTVERCFIGFEVEGSWGSPIHDITMHGNVFTNNYGAAIVLYGTGTNFREYYNIRILDNYIKRMTPHPDTPQPVAGIWLSAGVNLEVRGNRVSEILNGPAISMVTTFGSISNAIIADNHFSNALIGNNTFEFAPNTLHNLIAMNNEVDACLFGIRASGRNLQYTSNLVQNVRADGIELSASTNVLITHNVFESGHFPPTYIIGIRTNATNTTVYGNRFAGFTENQIVDEGNNTMVGSWLGGITNTEPPSVEAFGVPGRGYILESSPNLKDWAPAHSFASPAEGVYSLDLEPASAQFYRLVEEN